MEDGAAGHALDDAAGGFQEGGVSDAEQEISASGGCFGVDFQNLYGIGLGVAAFQVRENLGGAGVNLVGVSCGQRGSGEGS